MAAPSELMALSMPGSLSRRLGSDIQTGVVAAGSTQGGATAVTGALIEVATAGASTGIILQEAPSFFAIYNGGASPLSVYPPVGSFMNGTVNAAFSVTNAKTAFIFRSGARYIGILSA